MAPPAMLNDSCPGTQPAQACDCKPLPHLLPALVRASGSTTVRRSQQASRVLPRQRQRQLGGGRRSRLLSNASRKLEKVLISHMLPNVLWGRGRVADKKRA